MNQSPICRWRLLRDAFETNVIGCARIIRAFLPLLRGGHRPRILNVSFRVRLDLDAGRRELLRLRCIQGRLEYVNAFDRFELIAEGITTAAIFTGLGPNRYGWLGRAALAEESAHSLVQAIQTLSPELNGQFLDRFGKPGEYPW